MINVFSKLQGESNTYVSFSWKYVHTYEHMYGMYIIKLISLLISIYKVLHARYIDFCYHNFYEMELK